jgi:RNA polymerase sigma factor for flagellar operon FliA
MKPEAAIRQSMAGYADQNGETPAELINRNMALVRRIAWHISGRTRRTVEVDDLVQIGMVALVEAAQNYVRRPDAAFEAYATMRIRGAMLDEARRRAAMSRGALKRRRDLLNARKALGEALGREPLDTEVAAQLELTASEYAAQCEEARGFTYASLDEVYSDQSVWFASDEESPFDALARAGLQARLADIIAALPERESLVLQLYFVEELNLAEIGETLGVGAARVCQIKASALATVRRALGNIEDDEL